MEVRDRAIKSHLERLPGSISFACWDIRRCPAGGGGAAGAKIFAARSQKMMVVKQMAIPRIILIFIAYYSLIFDDTGDWGGLILHGIIGGAGIGSVEIFLQIGPT